MSSEQKTHLMDFWKSKFHFKEAELKAFENINREDFIPENVKAQAYDDVPLPTLRGKTISQPSTIMMMTSALELKKGDKVFEVGTGSGYQTAIIAEIVGKEGKVVSSEILPELVTFAKQNLKKSGIKNVEVHEDDGSKGFEEEAPYDKIIITAASKEFPKPLLEQLKVGGTIVGPVGNQNEQEMVRGTKDKKGKLELEFLGQFIFSPLYGKYGFED
jgi:protein-L-isoaspartate(D-aspartate) O-methyltransferase|tara:strand:- start:6012 stop:6659 length:648 start_codon:yes stop_codon:yes gene_type:complete